MPVYGAYGLAIDSEFDLAGLTQTSCSPEVTIRVGRLEAPREARESPWNHWVRPGAAWFLDPNCGTMFIEGGRSIVVDPPSRTVIDAVRAWVLGPGVATLLHQRGLLVLHASVVEFGGSAILFLGDSGAGKSTAAMTMCAHGGAVVSDDLAVLSASGDSILVHAGSTALRLLPDSILAYGERALSSRGAGGDKRLIFTRGYTGAPVPVCRIYLLVPAAGYAIAPVAQRDALMELVWKSFLAPILMPSGALEWHFKQCAAVAQRVPLRRLERSSDIANADRIFDLVTNDLQAPTC